jgi:hypothetical protein
VAPIVGAVIAGWSFEAITGIDRSDLDIGGAVNPGEVMTEPVPVHETGVHPPVTAPLSTSENAAENAAENGPRNVSGSTPPAAPEAR